MATASVLLREQHLEDSHVPNEARASGVSWPAVFAGAFVTCALSLGMLALGTGLGLSSISPWANPRAYSSHLGAAAVVWLILNEVISCAMGGYLAGRLRTKWTAVHTDEVYFRDTAHGFLVWAVAVVITASFLATAATSMVGGATGAMMAPSQTTEEASTNYFVDTLLRTTQQAQAAPDANSQAEVWGIFDRSLRHGELDGADKHYLDQLVSNRTGLSSAESDRRVSDVFNRAVADMNASRKATAHLLLWLFIALLIGAFSSSFAATIGGRQRDHIKAV